MGCHKSTLLLPFFIVLIVLDSQLGNSDPISDFVCSQVKDLCAHGTCKPSDGKGVPPFFDCDCDPGWKNLQIVNFTWPACLVPNCTIDLGCDGTPPPAAPTLPNNTATCLWCGDGNCVKEGDASVCQCNPGSANLFNKRDTPCFKECSFGADCMNLGFGLGSPPPPPSIETGTSVAPPSSTTFEPNKTGQGSGSGHDVPRSSRVQQTLLMFFVVGISLSFF